MLGGSARWGRWWPASGGSPSPERRRRRRRPNAMSRAASASQLLVETSYCSQPDLAAAGGSTAELEHRTDLSGAAAAAGSRPHARTYSLTRLHYSVYLEPDGAEAAAEAESQAGAGAGAATLPRTRPPITITGEETRITDDEPADDGKKKRKKKPLRKFLSVENLRKSVRKSKERMQGIDETLRRQARNTLQRMRTDRRGLAAHGAGSPPPSPAVQPPDVTDSEPELAEAPAADGEQQQQKVQPLEQQQRDISFADDSLTTSDEPGSTPVPPELSIQHELAMADRANDPADGSAAPRPAGETARAASAGRGGGGAGAVSERSRSTGKGAMDSGSDREARAADTANGQPVKPGTPPPPAPAAPAAAPSAPAGSSGPVSDTDAQVEKAEQAIEEQERARHRRLTDLGDNEVGNKFEHLYKILIIGELGTGKTSIIKRYVHQFFSAHYRATIGVDFALKVLHWDPNTTVRLQLWDIAGQERFGSMTRVYYKEAVAAFVVFDVTRSVTFDAVMKWKNDLDQKVQLANGDCVPCVLLANKCDLPKEGIVTTPEKLTEWAQQHGFLGWFETSAKENTGIEEAANFLVTKILTNEKSGIMASDEDDLDTLAVGDGQPDSKGCSC